MAASQPSKLSQFSSTSTSSNPVVEHDYDALSSMESDIPTVEPRMFDSLSDTLPAPRTGSPLGDDTMLIENEDVFGSDDNFSDIRPRAEEPDFEMLPRVPQHIADPMRHGLMTDHPDMDIPGIGPAPVPVALYDVRGRAMYSDPAPMPIPRPVPAGLPTPSAMNLPFVFPSAPDYHEPQAQIEEVVAAGFSSHMTDVARSEISELGNDTDNEHSVASGLSYTGSMFSETSSASDVNDLPSPSQDALHVILVGHKAPDQLKEEILEAVFALYPGHVVLRDTSTDEGAYHSSTLQFFDYRSPDLGNESSVEEVRVYDLTLRHAVTSYYNITGKMVTPAVPVLTVFFIDPALCKGRVPGFFPSAMIGQSIAVVLPRSDTSAPQSHLSPIGLEHSDLPKEGDYINISRGVDPADLMSAQHIWSNLKAAYLFDGLDIRHTVDFDRQVISIDELWAASARYEARSAALKLISPSLLPSVIRTNSSQEPASPRAEVESAPELSSSTSTIGGSVHTARGSAHVSNIDTNSVTLVNQEPSPPAEEPNEKHVNRALSLLEDAAALIGSVHLSNYAEYLPDKTTYAAVRSFVTRNARALGAIAVVGLAISALFMRGGSDTISQAVQETMAPLTPPPTAVRAPETSADAAAFAQKVHGMDIPRATPLLTFDAIMKPLGLSASPQPLSISGAGDLKTLDTSIIPLPMNTDLITVESKDCETCFQLVGSPKSKSDPIQLGGTTATPNVRLASETGATQSWTTTPLQAGAAVLTDKFSSVTELSHDIERVGRALSTLVAQHTRLASRNVRAINSLGAAVASEALNTLASTLSDAISHDSTKEDEEPSWYDDFMEPLRRALAERRERKELMLAEEDSSPSKRRPAREKIQDFLFRGAHALIA
ncbi:hypothetical protein CALVIDRAFT_543174 [Calocera viscosa TUFC12733]|uniref:Uncharacterized protein n=1 Tax=Calocera viscosa (strain TUFC12733) TaxID=1330018 RepID=A0A167FVU0_CALVF|nr:hypothetical protein CALVIDRAFT_543174 [Calocera viscosa TUFC12733]